MSDNAQDAFVGSVVDFIEARIQALSLKGKKPLFMVWFGSDCVALMGIYISHSRTSLLIDRYKHGTEPTLVSLYHVAAISIGEDYEQEKPQ